MVSFVKLDYVTVITANLKTERKTAAVLGDFILNEF